MELELSGPAALAAPNVTGGGGGGAGSSFAAPFVTDATSRLTPPVFRR
jgi:hypothetical protein